MSRPTSENASYAVTPKTHSRIPEVRVVLAALAEAGDVVRADAMARFKRDGGKLDRWGRADVEAMARAFTYAEDEIESRSRSPAPLRAVLRAVRRDLEDATETTKGHR